MKSNTNSELIVELICSLSNSRDNNGFSRQGLFLLSYPSVESFVASNFIDNSFELEFEIGEALKQYLDNQNINQSRISEESIIKAINEMDRAISQLGNDNYDLDNFLPTNLAIFNSQEENYGINSKYKLLSLLSIVLLDLGIS